MEVARIFDTIVAALRAHMAEEGHELFPALLAGRVDDAVPMLLAMRREHEEVGELLRDLRRAAADYRPPGWACNSSRTLMYELRALEGDVFEHLHVENHVLLPRFTAAS